MIGNHNDGGAGRLYLINALDLAAADAASGGANGEINLANVAAQANSYEISGVTAQDMAGVSNAAVGNNLLVGAGQVEIASGFKPGKAYLITKAGLEAADAADGQDGKVSLANIAPQAGSYEFFGTEPNAYIGRHVASAGDVDGDGTQDILIAAPYADPNGYRSGSVYLVGAQDLAAADLASGGTNGKINVDNIAAQPNSYQFDGVAGGHLAGSSVASLGDIDGDGRADILIGATAAGGSGRVYLVSSRDLAAADSADSTADGKINLGNIAAQTHSYEFIGAAAGDAAGASVAFAGDVTGDGKTDILIGAYGADQGGSASGSAYLISTGQLQALDLADGASDGKINLANVAAQPHSYEFIGAGADGHAGFSVSSAGDVDGDGRMDLLIGQPSTSGTGANATYLLRAKDLAKADAADGTIDGKIELARVRYNNIVEGTAGDDVIDKNYLFDPQLDRVDNNDNAAGNNDDVIRAGAGNDTIVSSEGNDTIDGGTGANTYQAVTALGGYELIGATEHDRSGWSVSSAGDVDGDGKADLFIGAPHARDNGVMSGSTYLMTAKDLAAADAADGNIDGKINLANLAAQPTSYEFVGAAADGVSSSVSSAGDVDGDGKADLIIGAYTLDSNGQNSGSAYLMTAKDLAAADAADGTVDGKINLANVAAQSTSYEFIGAAVNKSAGFSVASAGDVDGDGKADLIIGSPGLRTSNPQSGSSYLMTAKDLAAADAADGTVDGKINLANVAAQSTSYEFIGVAADDLAGISVSSAGDVDGDGKPDLIIGAYNADSNGLVSGSTYLMTAKDLAAADAADGAVDGKIQLSNVAAQSTSYEFIGAAEGDRSGWSVSSAGDVDGDGKADLIIGAKDASSNGSDSGSSYLMTAKDLAAADAADGTVDGKINLANVAAQSTSYEFIGAAGDRAGSVSSAGDVDGDSKADLIIGALAPAAMAIGPVLAIW